MARGERETHPSFGLVTVNRWSSSPGTSLFDSELRHQHFITLTVERADRTRDLNRDWIHGSGPALVQIKLSEAQWAAMVSSVGNGSGTPCTIAATETEPRVPEPPFEPRMAHSQAEARGAADRAFSRIKEAMAAYEEKKSAANLRSLRAAIAGAGPNVEFAAESLTEHAEKVVEKARADVEAMVTAHAERLGVSAPRYQELEGGQQ